MMDNPEKPYFNEPPLDFGAMNPNESQVDDQAAATPWTVLIVDDDDQVHQTTKLVLQKVRIFGRPLLLVDAYSAAEALEILARTPSVAVILLDAVMETEDAGFLMVEKVRVGLGLRDVRIILRTGQPGQTKELEVVAKYDINDYKTKQELTVTRLMTSLTTAIRDYQHLREISGANRTLRTILDCSQRLGALGTREAFTAEVMHWVRVLGNPTWEAQVFQAIPGVHRSWKLVSSTLPEDHPGYLSTGSAFSQVPPPPGPGVLDFPWGSSLEAQLRLVPGKAPTPGEIELAKLFAAVIDREWNRLPRE